MSTPSFPISTFSPEQLYFSSLGLTDIANRLAAVNANWQWFKVDESDYWKHPIFTSMLRTAPYKACRLAQVHEAQYLPFGELIQSAGTFLHFRFHADRTTLISPEHARQQRIIRQIREVLNAYLPKSIDKLGEYRDTGRRYNRTVKVLYAHPVSAELFAQIQSAVPPEVSVTRLIFHKWDFPSQLRAWAHADLPLDMKDRADLELLLHGIQQTSFRGIPAEIAAQFALESKKANANLTLPRTQDELLAAIESQENGHRRIPRSPKTGRFARFVSVTVDFHTRFEDIGADSWVSLTLPS